MNVLRADGREIEPGEYDALMETLRESITVRAEEILLEMPDGRKVTTLINATPIVSEEDEVLSVVVTVQDMTPIEEQERQRIEFLGMVSHELTAPRTTSSNLFTNGTHRQNRFGTSQVCRDPRTVPDRRPGHQLRRKASGTGGTSGAAYRH